jgi:serine/threonine protein kinase
MIGNNKINLKIGDFGLAADVIDSKRSRIELSKNPNFNSTTSLNHEYSVKLSENVGTPLYQSPEQIKNSLYNEKVDIYSLGLILLEICSFFKTYHERKLCLENVREHNIIPEKIKQDYPYESELILEMTATLPSKRPSALSLLKNEFFRKLEEEFDGNNKNK